MQLIWKSLPQIWKSYPQIWKSYPRIWKSAGVLLLSICWAWPAFAQHPLQWMDGKWLVSASNFSMWTQGGKELPSFNYTPTQRKGKYVLLDDVRFVKGGRAKSIKGIDFWKGEGRFVWRGNGMLRLLKSKWEVKMQGPGWAVITFSKTMFTPEGVDIISRGLLSEAEIKEIALLFSQKHPEFAPLLQQKPLQAIRQDGL